MLILSEINTFPKEIIRIFGSVSVFIVMKQLPTDNIKRKNPINRNNLFFSDQQYNFQVSVGMEYLNNVLNQTVVVYEIDHEKTNMSDIYAESKFENIVFKTPVEINVRFTLNDHELKAYDSKTIKGHYVKVGKLEFGVYEKELEKCECDIQRGDYIGLQVTPEHMEFFIVTDDGRVNYDNAHTYAGTKPFYRSVKCATVGDITETIGI